MSTKTYMGDIWAEIDFLAKIHESLGEVNDSLDKIAVLLQELVEQGKPKAPRRQAYVQAGTRLEDGTIVNWGPAFMADAEGE
jgi:hypothetical protein